MTKLTKKEYMRLMPPPNVSPLWSTIGTILGLMILAIIGLGLIWLIKILVEAIF